ncbi:MAG: prepilin-type N-terminal cleavage/methylation domain-containing protein [Nitrospinae bacterium]|nr:prepilin-type N-terminal cleavage/methylation domain-containing protein [Nitrospinota bacterium]
MKTFKSEKGFTLIELLVVVAIIGILVAIAIPQFANYKKQANDGKCQSDIHNLALAAESYYATNGEYPVSATGITSSATSAPLESSGFKVSPGTSLSFTNATTTFSATCYHSGGTKTFTWNTASGGLQ